MTEIVKVFRERVPAARLIGKRYSMAEEGAASHWGEWFENGWFLPLEMLGALKESEGAFYGFMVARGEEDREYWIGMLFPAGTQAPEGYESLDLPEGEAGVCYLRAHEQDPTLYTMHAACVRALRQAGMDAPEGAGSAEQPFCALSAITAPALPRPTAKAASFWIMACIFAQRENGREPRKAYGCAMATGRCTSKPMRPWWNI